MLHIFTLAYQGAPVSEAPVGTTRKEIQHTIFTRYVERMLVHRRELPRHWRPDQVIHCLRFLARQMLDHDQTVFSVENLQPTWLPERWRILYKWFVGLGSSLTSGLCSGLVVGLVAGLFFGLLNGLIIGVIVELFSSLFIGLWLGWIVWQDPRINPAEALTWSWKKARSGLVAGLLLGLLFGAVLTRSLLFSLLLGPVAGLLVGLLFGPSRSRLPERLSLSPNEGIWRSARNGLLFLALVGSFFGLGSGLLFGLIQARISGLVGGLITGLVTGLAVGPTFGWFVGVAFGLDAFVKHFILRALLSRRGDLPQNLVPFLDEAAERLLLRKVGGSYIFMHRLLLDYFDTLNEPGHRCL